jgi:peroxiredoxin
VNAANERKTEHYELTKKRPTSSLGPYTQSGGHPHVASSKHFAMNVLIFIPWMVVGFGCWIGYHLVRQNGRILLRLESLEQQLRESRLGGVQQVQAAPTVPAGLQLGSAAPSFELPDLAGRTRKLSEWRGRRVLLIFFNPKCGFCVQMAPAWVGLPQDRLGAAPLLITTGDPLENQKFFDEYGLPGPVLLQKQMEIASIYRVSGTPVGYLVDEEGKIASEMTAGAQALPGFDRRVRCPATQSSRERITSKWRRN